MADSETEREARAMREVRAMLEDEEDDDDNEESIMIGLFPAADDRVSPDREGVVQKARALMDTIVATKQNVSPAVVNELAGIVEEEEARYQEIAGYPYVANSRSAHTIGRLLSMFKERDDFYDLFCSTLAVQGSVAQRAAGTRLLLSAVSCWQNYHNLDDAVLYVLKQMILEEFDSSCPESVGAKSSKKEKTKAKDVDLLHTYSLGLYVLALMGSAEVVEESLARGLAVKLMRYLRHYIFGDSVDTPAKSGHKNWSAHVKEEGEDSNKAETSKKKSDLRGGKHRPKTKTSDAPELPRVEVEVEVEAPKLKPKSLGMEAFEMEENKRVYMAGTVDISAPTRKAVIAARNEARGANGSEEAAAAAGDAAAELVKCAAFEIASGDEAAVLAAAEAAAETVIDAAHHIRNGAENMATQSTEQNAESSLTENGATDADDHGVDTETLTFLKVRYAAQCLDRLGEYVEVLGPILQEKGVDVCMALLRRFSQDPTKDMDMVSDVLKMIVVLCTHRKFLAVLVDRGFVQQLLTIPLIPQTTTGLALWVYTVSLVQNVMERICALPSAVIADFVSLACQLLESPPDVARRHAGQFFTHAFAFRPIIEAFDNQDGPRKLLNVLSNTASLRSGVPTATQWQILNSSEKQVAHHSFTALRNYFRSQFLMLVESLRTCKHRTARNAKNPCKALEIGHEAVEDAVEQLLRDRKLAAAFVRTKWPALENFMNYSGHVLALEFCQPSNDRGFNELAQHSLSVLHLVTLMPNARRVVVSSTLANERPGMTVILDAASGSAFPETEVIRLALFVLVNLVCPPPAFSSRSGASGNSSHQPNAELRDRVRVEENAVQSCGVPVSSSAVGDSRISLGPGYGGPGLATYMEQGYRTAREAVRTNNGIKVLLHLLHPKTVMVPSSNDCIRALACRVLVGLARDETIAQILTKLQLGKILAELLRDGGQSKGGDQDRWQTELSQVALDLMGIVTNAGRANTVASEAAAPTLRRIERAAIAAATPISYHSRELLQLIHEHLLASGLVSTASTLLKESSLQPLPPTNQSRLSQADPHPEIHWPGSRYFTCSQKQEQSDEDHDTRKKNLPKQFVTPKKLNSGKGMEVQEPADTEVNTALSSRAHPLSRSAKADAESDLKTPSTSRTPSAKRKACEKDGLPMSPNKRIHLSEGSSGFHTPQVRFKTTDGNVDKPWLSQAADIAETDSPSTNLLPLASEPKNDRASLDSLVVQYLKHQHRQCPTPITTLPELSLLHPHVCPEPSRVLYAPYNMTSRLRAREIYPPYGGGHGPRYNRHFIYSKFRQMRSIRDDHTGLFTCGTFLGGAWGLAVGTHTGQIRLFDSCTSTVKAAHQGHSSRVTSVQAAPYLLPGSEEIIDGARLLLSSASVDVKLWNSSTLEGGPLHTFDSCKGARFNRLGTTFGCWSDDGSREVCLYDVNTCSVKQKLTDSSIGPVTSSSRQSIVHFSPSDVLVLWSGVLWDYRIPRATHRFDQFTDYGGGGFHPAGNEVIINSEVWDLRTFKLLRSVPSLDQTIITFNGTGDVIYATLRRSHEEVTSSLTKRTKHPLFSAFRTMDAVDYCDIATTQVDRCVLDLAVEPTDSLIGVVGIEPQEAAESCVKFYEVGRRRPTEGDSDPDDAIEETDEEADDSDMDQDDDDGILDDLGIMIDGEDEEVSDEDEDGDGDMPVVGGIGVHLVPRSDDDSFTTSSSDDEDDDDDGVDSLNGFVF